MILSDSNLKKYAITENQWANFIKIQDFLFPFKEVTTIMSSSSYPTLSMTIPLYNILIDHVEDILKESNDENDGNKDGNKIDEEAEADKEIESAETEKDEEWNQLIKEASNKCRTKLLEYYNKTGDSYLISIILDPRLKLQYFQDHEWGETLINDAQQKLVYYIYLIIIMLFYLFINIYKLLFINYIDFN